MSNEENVELTDGFHLLIDVLKDNGIDTMYGVVGIPITNLARLWQEDGQKFYSFRAEQHAGYAASIAGYIQGKPGVALTVSAPGFLNGVTALAHATTNCFPMLLLSGSSERDIVDLQQGDYEEMDQFQIAKPHCKASYRINSIRDIPIGIARAMRTALTGRPGGVYVDLPARLFGQTMPLAEANALRFTPAPIGGAAAPEADVARAAEVIKAAKKPVAVIGKGCAYARAEAEVKAFIEETGIPFLPMGMGKGTIPDNHPLSAAANRARALAGCDVCILIAARLNWLMQHGKGKTWGNELKKYVQFDVLAQEMDSNQPIAAPVVGDVKVTLPQVTAAVKGYKAPAEWCKEIFDKVAANKEKLKAKLTTYNGGEMNYQNSLNVVKEYIAANPNVNLVNEGANALDNTRMVVDVLQPRRRLDTGTWGVMGIGMGYCVAAATVTSDPVIAVEGDSAFGFSGMEIETITRYQLPVTIIVMNNGGIYKGNEADTGGQISCTRLGRVRYDLMMEALGGKGYLANNPTELKAALEEAVASKKPCLINAMIDPDAGVESGRIKSLNVVSNIGKKK
ncbi:MAG: oxalyl-CoA decarboxylase [Oxalobacter sp.]|jgi:oxalyl-CoA decarboxylase|nr:oxalyl-CoA decarboxylase [Oxalobacter sp.]